jgi:hypothetical protein
MSLPTVPTADATLNEKVLAVYQQALSVLKATMEDRANRPKEALQAAKLVMQKINPKLWIDLLHPKAQPAQGKHPQWDKFSKLPNPHKV